MKFFKHPRGVFQKRWLIKSLFVMKLTFIIVLISCMQVSAKSYSQTVTLNLKSVNLKKALANIEKQSDFRFLYSERKIANNDKVNINVTNAGISQVMDQLLTGTGLTYKELGNNLIVLLKKNEVIQDIVVKGKVTDRATGKPLTGASIEIKGSSFGTTTDASGNYSINAPDKATLIVSSVGYDNVEIPVNGRTEINISLQSSTTGLNDVVVVGYGTEKKKDLTGAISTVNGDAIIADRPITSVGEALQGQIPGLTTTPSSDPKPGASYSFNIRGTTSINGGSPLVLVNGVEMDPNLIPPDDIASITVLKDASSAIYGARAAFGVILITTKKGRKNEPTTLTYSNNFSSNVPTTLPDKVDPETQITNEGIAWTNGNNPPGTYWGKSVQTWLGLYKEPHESNSDVKVNGAYYPLGNTNMIKAMTAPGFTQNHDLSISGGSEKISYRLNAGLMEQNGVLVGNKDRFSRKSVGGEINVNATKWLNIEGNLSYTSAEQDFPFIPNSESYLYSVSYIRPTFWLTGMDDSLGIPWGFSPEMVALGAENPNITDNPNIQLVTTLNPLKGLEITGRYTFRGERGNQTNHVNTYQMANPPDGQAYYYDNVPNSITRTAMFSNYNVEDVWAQYEKRFNSRHDVKLMGGYSQEESSSTSYYAEAQNLITDNIPSLSLGTGNTYVGDNINQWSTRSLFSRLNYSYSGKYLAEIILRYDGSSKFAPNHRYVVLPSVLLGWRISDESFMKKHEKWVSNLKLRLSYGIQGNQDIASYAYTPSLGTTRANWIVGGITPVTLTPAPLVSSSFTWEKVENYNTGLDFGFLDNRLNGSLDIYRRNTIGMIVPVEAAPALLGTSAPQQNAANLQVNGFEFDVNWEDHLSNDFSYRIGMNIYNSMAKITKYNGNPAGLISSYNVGRPLGEIWGYVTDRLFTASDFVTTANGTRDYSKDIPRQDLLFSKRIPFPGDVKYKDINGDGVINYGDNTVTNPGDRKVIGNSTPQYQFGFNLDINYKRFGLSMFLQGVAKKNLWLNQDFMFIGSNGGYDADYKNTLDFWTPTNTNAFFPRPNTQTWNKQVQTRYLQNAAYIRFKNVRFSYTLPIHLVSKVKLKSTRIYFSAENLFLLSGLPKGVDPEIGSNPTFPLEKDYSFGINIQL